MRLLGICTFLVSATLSSPAENGKTCSRPVSGTRAVPHFVRPQVTLKPRIVDGRLCVRNCVHGEAPLICTFRFTLEYYSTMGPACRNCPQNTTSCFEPHCVTADGVERGIMTVNRQMPGPEVQVCKGDIVVVDVVNHLHGSSTTIHWHGILQRDAQFMDGVPMLTQCPIVEGTTFRYAFPTDEPGTFFWHSHDGFQKMDGITGALIVRDVDDPSRRHYDKDLPEHVILLHDWINQYMAERIPGPRRLPRRGQLPDSLLINGRGSRQDPVTGQFNQMPLSEFRVRRGRRYRFRLIHAGCLICPLRFSIEGHVLSVIATDSFPVRPQQVNSIVIMSGERYDFVLDTRNKVAANYWITVVGLGECARRNLIQNAILIYEGARGFAGRSQFPAAYPAPGLVMNPLNVACRPGDQGVCVTQLEAENPPQKIDPVLTATRVVRLTLDFDFHEFTYDELFHSGKHFKFYVPVIADMMISGRMNNVSLVMPSAPPLSQPEVLSHMCSSGSEMCCLNAQKPPAIATHRQCFNLITIPLGSVVEILFMDNVDTNGTMSHPIHTHGTMFYVMELGTAADRANGRHRLFPTPRPFSIKKDTVVVPSNGYARVRFNATNPGYWLVHCHVLVHSDSGMAVVLQVGRHNDIPPVPKNFPRCGNYLPTTIKLH